jgi:hypothetical protein
MCEAKVLSKTKVDPSISENRLKSIRDVHKSKKDGRQEEEQQQLHTDRMEDYLEVIYELIRQ